MVLGRGGGSADVVALRAVHTERSQRVELLGGLDAFGDDGRVDVVGEGD